MLLSLLYFLKLINQGKEKILKFLQKVRNVRGLFLLCSNRRVVHFKSKLLEIKTIFFFYFELCVNKV